MQVGGSFHGMIQIKQAVLMATGGGCKNWTFDCIRILQISNLALILDLFIIQLHSLKLVKLSQLNLLEDIY